MKFKTSFRTKIALIIFGVCLFFLLLETGLRLGGSLILSIQEYRNLKSAKDKGAYRILCLGESTTAGQYPAVLEEVLNRAGIGIRFSVIDKGRWGVVTQGIVYKLESDLRQYHPDMVVVMMGINDWVLHIPDKAPTTSKFGLFFRSLRTYKLPGRFG
jgi:lysophospholipase L1-like esterase